MGRGGEPQVADPDALEAKRLEGGTLVELGLPAQPPHSRTAYWNSNCIWLATSALRAGARWL
jgi:hypothetical protein